MTSAAAASPWKALSPRIAVTARPYLSGGPDRCRTIPHLVPLGLPLQRTRSSGVELALATVLPVTVFAFVMGSSSVAAALRVGHSLRWVLLFVLAGLALVFGWSTRPASRHGSWLCRRPRRRGAPVGRVVGQAPDHGGAVGELPAPDDGGRVRRRRDSPLSRRGELVLVALLAGPVLVAVAGLVVYLADHDRSMNAGRFQGFGQNPNTVSMLLAVALSARGLAARGRARSVLVKAAAAIAAVLLYGSVLWSDSRGAMFAWAVGVVVFAAVRVHRVRVLVPVVAVLIAAFAASFRIPAPRPGPALAASPSPTSPSPSPSVSSGAAAPTTTTTEVTRQSASRFTVGLLPVAGPGPVPFVPERDEIGFPGIYQQKRILTYGSGRVYAWLSALREGLERPILGHGFGTEPYVFVDRFYLFDGGYAENSFVGMFLTARGRRRSAPPRAVRGRGLGDRACAAGGGGTRPSDARGRRRDGRGRARRGGLPVLPLLGRERRDADRLDRRLCDRGRGLVAPPPRRARPRRRHPGPMPGERLDDGRAVGLPAAAADATLGSALSPARSRPLAARRALAALAVVCAAALLVTIGLLERRRDHSRIEKGIRDRPCRDRAEPHSAGPFRYAENPGRSGLLGSAGDGIQRARALH